MPAFDAVANRIEKRGIRWGLTLNKANRSNAIQYSISLFRRDRTQVIRSVDNNLGLNLTKIMSLYNKRVMYNPLSVWRVQAVVVSAYGVEGCSSVMRWTVVVVVCVRRRDLTLIVWQYCWAVHPWRRHTVHPMLICTVRTTRLEPWTRLLVYRRTLPLVDVATGWLYMASPWRLRDIIMNWYAVLGWSWWTVTHRVSLGTICIVCHRSSDRLWLLAFSTARYLQHSIHSLLIFGRCQDPQVGEGLHY